MLLKLIALLLLALTLASSCSATTEVRGAISRDTTWQGLVHVFGAITVRRGAVLRVMPGARVTFAPGASLTVNGAIEALDARSGAARQGDIRSDARPPLQNPVEFAAPEGSPPGSWQGLILAPADSKQPPSRLYACRISGAVNGVALKSDASAPHSISGCEITRCSLTGLRLGAVSGASIERNLISNCGTLWVNRATEPTTESAGIWLQGAHGCSIRENTITGCNENGIRLDHADYNTIQGSFIQNIAGDHMKLHGMGIWGLYSSRNLILGNTIGGISYICICFGGGCQENVIADNWTRDFRDAINFNGHENARNLVRNCRILNADWSQLYVTSECIDNRFENCEVRGTGWGLTSNCGFSTTFEDCDFYGSYPINVWGYGGVTLRRCRLHDHVLEYDLHMTYNAQAVLVDCELDRSRIKFGEGTQGNEHSRVYWKHSVALTVLDAATGAPVWKAAVTAKADGGGEPDVVALTGADGVAHLELTELVITPDDSRPVTPHTLTVVADGHKSLTLAGLPLTGPLTREVRLEPQGK